MGERLPQGGKTSDVGPAETSFDGDYILGLFHDREVDGYGWCPCQGSSIKQQAIGGGSGLAEGLLGRVQHAGSKALQLGNHVIGAEQEVS